jgi:hypothetical protein
VTGEAHAGPSSWGEYKNRIGIAPRAAFNIEANFNNLGGFPARTDIGPAAPGYDHFYDDGFNRVDASGNAGGATWYWRYERASQIVGGDTLVMSSTSSEPEGQFEGVTDDPHWSGEITYARELGWNSSYWWGLIAGVSYNRLKFGETHSFTTPAVQIRDSYPILGPLPPAPYEGSFSQPGVQIGDSPTRESRVLSQPAATDGEYELDAEGYGFRLGLLFETPFSDTLDLQFGGGFAGMWIRSDFRLRESTSIIEAGTFERDLEDSDSDFVVGAYGEAGFSLRVSKRVSIQAAAQYYYLSDYSHSLGPEEAELDFRSAIFGVLGVTYAF